MDIRKILKEVPENLLSSVVIQILTYIFLPCITIIIAYIKSMAFVDIILFILINISTITIIVTIFRTPFQINQMINSIDNKLCISDVSMPLTDQSNKKCFQVVVTLHNSSNQILYCEWAESTITLSDKNNQKISSINSKDDEHLFNMFSVKSNGIVFPLGYVRFGYPHLALKSSLAENYTLYAKLHFRYGKSINNLSHLASFKIRGELRKNDKELSYYFYKSEIEDLNFKDIS